MFSVDELKDLNKQQLLAVAKSVGVIIDGRTSEENIRATLITLEEPKKEQNLTEKITSPKAVVMQTPDAVNEAIKHCLAKAGFEAKYPDDATTWNFKYKGAEDSGSMSMPLKHIVMKANQVARGAINPSSFGFDGADRSYAGRILAV